MVDTFLNFKNPCIKRAVSFVLYKGSDFLKSNAEASQKVAQSVELYADMVFRIAYQNMGQKADAEDVVQDVFLKLMSAPDFTSQEHCKARLIRVTINRCKDLHRSAWRSRTQTFDDLEIPVETNHKDVLNEIFRLPPDDRTMIYLYYFEGYKVPEIAKMLEIKENTVSSRISRARKKLKGLLEGGDF